LTLKASPSGQSAELAIQLVKK